MKNHPPLLEKDLTHKLKWLMFSRVLFTSFLLGSTIILQLSERATPMAPALLFLYAVIVGIFVLSFVYSLILNRVKRIQGFAFVQICLDTLAVTLIVFLTGGFVSIFSFLYLVVVIYSAILLFKRGSMVVAAFCSFQYALLIGLEYAGLLSPFSMMDGTAVDYPWSHVLNKLIIITTASFAVAFLSDLLAQQERKTKEQLLALEAEVKRVEKLAYLGEMAAGIAHEIKNPLASLAGSIQLLQEDIDGNAVQEKLMQIVLRETDRLSSLVNNFLMFARPPAGKSEAVNLNVALSETLSLFEKDVSCCKRVAVTHDFFPDMWVKMDPVHLRQVFWNLLLNAAEAIVGQGWIKVKTFPARHKCVAIEVIDSGCGMPADVIEAIFNPFFTTKADGTGLGLSIVHSILETYGSRLSVQSKVNEGSVFTLKLKRITPPTKS